MQLSDESFDADDDQFFTIVLQSLCHVGRELCTKSILKLKVKSKNWQ